MTARRPSPQPCAGRAGGATPSVRAAKTEASDGSPCPPCCPSRAMGASCKGARSPAMRRYISSYTVRRKALSAERTMNPSPCTSIPSHCIAKGKASVFSKQVRSSSAVNGLLFAGATRKGEANEASPKRAITRRRTGSPTRTEADSRSGALLCRAAMRAASCVSDVRYTSSPALPPQERGRVNPCS